MLVPNIGYQYLILKKNFTFSIGTKHQSTEKFVVPITRVPNLRKLVVISECRTSAVLVWYWYF